MRFLNTRRLFFFLIFLLNGSLLFAQNTSTTAPPASSAIGDSVKAKKNNPKIRIVNGSLMSAASDIVANIKSSKDFTTLFKALDTAELTETFRSKGPLTIFAPDNGAFDKLPKGKLDSLFNPQNKLNLTNLLTYHALAGKISSKDIEKQIKAGNGQATFVTLAGSKLTARINENRNIVLTDESGGQSIVSIFDVEQSNGMLHVINAVLIPKNKI